MGGRQEKCFVQTRAGERERGPAKKSGRRCAGGNGTEGRTWTTSVVGGKRGGDTKEGRKRGPFPKIQGTEFYRGKLGTTSTGVTSVL